MNQLSKLHEVQVTYNRNYGKNTVTNSSTAYEICKQAYSLTECNILLKEYFLIILLNRANEVICFYKLSEGGTAGTVVDVKIAFSIAMKCLASGMIITHNHPTGKLIPSDQDQRLTNKFSEAGKLLDCQLLDHLIISSEGYYSFADNGLI